MRERAQSKGVQILGYIDNPQSVVIARQFGLPAQYTDRVRVTGLIVNGKKQLTFVIDYPDRTRRIAAVKE